MKKQLFPILGLGCASLSIAPITLTSCASDSLDGHMFDLTKNYQAKFERAQPQALPIHDINEVYMNKLNENKDVFIDDYYWSRSYVGSAFEPFVFWEQLFDNYVNAKNETPIERFVYGPARSLYSYDNEVISNLSLYTKQYQLTDGSTWTIPMLSFTLNTTSKISDITFSRYIGTTYLSGYINGMVTCEMKFTDVPFRVIMRHFIYGEQQFTNKVLSFEPYVEWMLKLQSASIPTVDPDPWRLDISISSTISGELKFSSELVQRIADDWEFNMLSTNDNPTWSYGGLTFPKTICYLFTSSHYLDKLSCTDL